MANNLLPDFKKRGFFDRIKLFFKSITFKHDKLIQEHKCEDRQENPQKNQESFIEDLKANTDVDKACENETLEYVVEKVEENPQILDNLSVDQLEKVNVYYDHKIQEIDNEINKIKKN